MLLLDVNVLVYAFRPDATRHRDYRQWLEQRRAAPEPLAVAELVLSGFVRVVTHPRIFRDPDALPDALSFAAVVRAGRNSVTVAPGPRHWEIFCHLCRAGQARGNLVADAYLAALAIESGSIWITCDRDFARFPGLRWQHPLD